MEAWYPDAQTPVATILLRSWNKQALPSHSQVGPREATADADLQISGEEGPPVPWIASELRPVGLGLALVDAPITRSLPAPPTATAAAHEVHPLLQAIFLACTDGARPLVSRVSAVPRPARPH